MVDIHLIKVQLEKWPVTFYISILMKPYPFKVLHTDVTQVRLANTKWAYVSAITDEASKEVLTF